MSMTAIFAINRDTYQIPIVETLVQTLLETWAYSLDYFCSCRVIILHQLGGNIFVDGWTSQKP